LDKSEEDKREGDSQTVVERCRRKVAIADKPAETDFNHQHLFTLAKLFNIWDIVVGF
jgi:hypothetical protein